MGDRCSTCPWRDTDPHYPIPADGPQHAKVLFVAEAPGLTETERGRNLCGRTGREFNDQYLPLAGLRRHDVRTINTMACYPPGGKLDPASPKHSAMVAGCANAKLRVELESTQAEIVVAMGHWANRHTGGDLDMEMEYGIPRSWKGRVLFPSYHPAVALHNTGMISAVREAFYRLKLLRDGKLRVPRDQYPSPDYRILRAGQVELHMTPWAGQPIAVDTETSPKGAFCLTFSAQPGTGYMILADDEESVREFAWYLKQWTAPVLIHNCLFDLPVLRSMGVEVPRHWLRDTMMRCYHLANMPQALKVLSYRYLGVRQQSFEDLVMPYATVEALGYLERAAAIQWPKPEADLVMDNEGHWKMYRPQGINQKLKRLFTDLGKNPGLDVFARWDNWVSDGSAAVVTTGGLGPFPKPSVELCHLPDVVNYACADADVTLRLWPILERASRRVRGVRNPMDWALDLAKDVAVSC